MMQQYRNGGEETGPLGREPITAEKKAETARTEKKRKKKQKVKVRVKQGAFLHLFISAFRVFGIFIYVFNLPGREVCVCVLS